MGEVAHTYSLSTPFNAVACDPVSGNQMSRIILALAFAGCSVSASLASTSAPSPSPSEALTAYSCDVAVIGQGLAGAVAVATVARQRPSAKVCSIGPGAQLSTSSLSGRPWLLSPDVSEPQVAPLLDALDALSQRYSLPFDRSRAEHFVRTAGEAEAFIAEAANVSFEPVGSYRDSYAGTCADIDCSCTAGVRRVVGHGAFYCNQSSDQAREWYARSGCCGANGSVLLAPGSATWPTYHVLGNLLDGKVKWAVPPKSDSVPTGCVSATATRFPETDAGKGNLPMYDILKRLLAHASTVVTGTVIDARHDGTLWQLTGSDFTVASPRTIFATGGFGAAATPAELEVMGVASTAEILASDNTGLLWSTAKREGWSLDPLNGWYLEHMDGDAKWFLFEDGATVLAEQSDGSYSLVYNEAASYDERGRARKQAGAAAELKYAYRDATATATLGAQLGAAAQAAVTAGAVIKSCEERSQRLWRNFISQCYAGGFGTVGKDACASRVLPSDLVTVKTLKNGLIDTIAGPVVDKDQKFHIAGWSAGNAASPGLVGMYTGPGSTLGNALQSGYLAGRDVVRDMSGSTRRLHKSKVNDHNGAGSSDFSQMRLEASGNAACAAGTSYCPVETCADRTVCAAPLVCSCFHSSDSKPERRLIFGSRPALWSCSCA